MARKVRLLSKSPLVAVLVFSFVLFGTPTGSAPAAEAGANAGHLGDVTSLEADGAGYCALLTSGGVDCWGGGTSGQLGNGIIYNVKNSGHQGSASPVQVEGVDGTGTLSGVASLVSGGSSYCALLTSGGVDCWGWGVFGGLGDGIFYTGAGPKGSAVPVAVEGVGGTGTLGGVTNLASDGGSVCAVLNSGGVDCWGEGIYGELGNGVFYSTGYQGSAVPVQVEGVGGTGTLTGVASLTAQFGGDCALLTSEELDCWGFGAYGNLGNGVFDSSAVPVQVEGVGGSGTLTGITALANAGAGYCALLTSGGVDCWGDGEQGQLGNGQLYTTDTVGSATPVEVQGVGGTGTLAGAASVIGEDYAVCALLTSGGVDCWGYGAFGQLGDGVFYPTPTGFPIPVQVEGVGGTGTLSGVASLTSGAGNFCAVFEFWRRRLLGCWKNGPTRQWDLLHDGR